MASESSNQQQQFQIPASELKMADPIYIAHPEPAWARLSSTPIRRKSDGKLAMFVTFHVTLDPDTEVWVRNS